VVTRYAHLQGFAPGIAPGSPVSAGHSIGKVGHTGHAPGSHVHFEVRIAGRPVDPRPYLALVPCTGVTEARSSKKPRFPPPAPIAGRSAQRSNKA
jgi:hypothetical protein